MTTALHTVPLLRPDGDFVEAVVRTGGADLKKCYQCATCSVACGLATGRAAFPRKEMLWAQWGLKDRLMADPDVWLCHQCNDCSARCPRGARPGDVLAAVRRQVVEHYAVPRAVARLTNRSGIFCLSLVVPAVLIALALAVRDPIGRLIGEESRHGFYAEFFPHWLLIALFSLFSGIATALVAVGGLRFWRAMSAADARAGLASPSRPLGLSVRRALASAFAHDRFRTCEARESRRTTHMMAFYGFLALFVTTVWAVIDLYVMPSLGQASMYPFGLAHPLKWFANVGALALVVGAGKAIYERASSARAVEASTSFDWIFPALLLVIGVTGIVIEVLRFVAEGGAREAVETTAYALYFVHLVLVFALLVYLPYSKFAHVVYRSIATVYAEHTGRTADAVSAPAAAGAEPRPVATTPGTNPN